MYPHRQNKKTALPKAEMQLARKLLGPRSRDQEVELINLSGDVALHRVVVKRPDYFVDDISSEIGSTYHHQHHGRRRRCC